MRKTVIIFLAVIIACGVLFAFSRSRKTAQADGTSPTGHGGRGGMGQQAVSVAVSEAFRKDMPVYVEGLGSVQAFYTVTLRTRVDGEAQQVYFKEGQDVKQGEMLVQIDPRPYQVAVSMAEATLLKDQSQLEIAKRNFLRYQDLFKQGVVAQTDFDAQQSNYGALDGQVKADQAALDNAKLNLAYCRITSPIPGRVGLRLVDPGNMVHAADANGLLVITQLRPITTVFTVPEDSLPQVVKAEHAQRKALEVDVFSRDDQTKLATGSLATINNQIDQTTGTVRLKAVFDNTEGLLWPNQFVNARLLLDTLKDVVVVPAAAIQRGVQGTFVFVVGQDNTVQIKPVKVGVTDGDLIAISSGLQAGDQIVTDGQDKLQAGSKVQVRPSGGGSPGGSGGAASPGSGRGQHTTQVPVGM